MQEEFARQHEIAWQHPDEIQTKRLLLKRTISADYNVTYYLLLNEVQIGYITIHSDGEIWYFLHTPHLHGRQGFMTEAMNSVLQKSPRDHFYLDIVHDNIPSLALARKLGFIENVDDHPFKDMFCTPIHQRFFYTKA